VIYIASLADTFSFRRPLEQIKSKTTEEQRMRRYHHLGIPTTIPREEEQYLEKFKVSVSGYETSPYGIEWMRFEPDSPLPELVKTVPHVAFVVDNLAAEIAGKEILIQPNSPSEGVTVAFIVDNGAPVEFLQFDKPEK
jgi:hypothetical protein